MTSNLSKGGIAHVNINYVIEEALHLKDDLYRKVAWVLSKA